MIELDQACFLDHAWNSGIWKGLAEHHDLILYRAASGPSPVGFLVLDCVPPDAELIRIGVRMEFRRRGIGRYLIAMALSDLAREGIRTVFLEVRKDHMAACRLYRNCGFQEIGKRRHYYHFPPADAILFSVNTQCGQRTP